MSISDPGQVRQLLDTSESRRVALHALGVAGIGTALANTLHASAKPSAGKRRKKAKKRCTGQQQACRAKVPAFCIQFGVDAQFCQDALLPCCDTCDVPTNVICAAAALSGGQVV